MFKHLDDVGLGYCEHAKAALGLAGSCLRAAGLLAVHAIYPDFGGNSGTEILKRALKQVEETQRGELEREEKKEA